MIRTLFATTALATLVATGAFAQTATPAQPPAAENPAPVIRSDGALMTNIIGESVYNGTGDDAQNIGKIDDVVFDASGKTKSAIIGVGGFLGVGTKDVAFDYSKMEWAEKNGDRWLVAKTTKDELNAQPAFDRKPYDPAPAPSAAATQPSTTDTGGAQKPVDLNAKPAEPVKKAEGNLATNIMGESVYNGTADDAQKIGDVKDIVLAKDGKAESLVIGVGGFLGIGTKNVTFDFAKAKWAEKNGDRWLVAETTKEELEAQPDFNRKAYDPAPAPATAASNNAPATTTPAVASSDTTAGKEAKPAQTTAENKAPAPAASTAQNKPADSGTTATDTTQTASIDKSTLTEMPMGNIRGDDLKGATVYGANDAKIGTIGDVVLTPDNKPDAVIVDVGGFLGIGAKEVAVGMDKLKFMTDKDGKKYLYTNFTKEELQAQAAYDKSSYAANRDKQRMILK
ncbi:MAG: PRC-barrel domain containing protein [Mesorhizobium sp.]|uniref:PRC-barrel domain-containing protein n=1 Tax=Mesorhizobium sp. TaxID=1871066 RepID=UPI0012188510|nr:PRC-barrel domain-containing protein [Mesorhizobium sp.]TIO76623.1 MAG: PRC-barrel domain containing protein [Mesorhizobium sp.]TIO83494.1 MAG: PRC-barrel domain containing protein [Mesorhizobium sp.]